MANPLIKGPGMLWVTSCISKPDVLDEKTYLRWYDEDHIAEIIETSGIGNAFRYVDVDKGKVKKPYLAFYPMADIAFTQGDEFRKIKVQSDLLPPPGICYDLADIDVRYISLVGKTETKKSKKELAQYLVVSGIEPADGAPNEEVTMFFDQQIEKVSEAPSYIRTTRFNLLYARTNAQSRKLKGLPTTDEPAPEPPTWMVIHEFAGFPTDVKDMISNTTNEVSSRAKQFELSVYRFAKAHGGKNFFE